MTQKEAAAILGIRYKLLSRLFREAPLIVSVRLASMPPRSKLRKPIDEL